MGDIGIERREVEFEPLQPEPAREPAGAPAQEPARRADPEPVQDPAPARP